MNTEIWQLLEQGMTLVTPTKRLSRHLQSQYGTSQLNGGKLAWNTADILPWNAWLLRCWETLCLQEDSSLYLLSAHQQQSLWQQIVSRSAYAEHLLQANMAAKQALDAWKLLQQWQISSFPDDLYLNEDVRVFRGWAVEYQKQCEHNNWFDEARLEQVCGKAICQDKLKLNQTIALIGFTELTPQQRTLLEQLQQSGCDIRKLHQEQRSAQLSYASFPDTRQEIRAAAHWARRLVEQDNTGSIGIVVPNLQRTRNIVEAEFEDMLDPGAILSPMESEQGSYAVSLGQPVNRYPMVHCALTLLSLLRQPYSLQDLSSVLRSPFIIAAQNEQSQRTKLDAALHEYGETHLSLRTLRYVIEKSFAKAQGEFVFITCLCKWAELIQSQPNKQSPMKWAQTFSELLRIFSWPGERPLSSAEYQTLEAWQELLKHFASLQLITPELSLHAALSQLRRLAADLSFQPETAESPIQVLGMTGAAEMQFDHLWVMGLHEEVWPQAAQPNPFIPLQLQRERGMPRASAEIELDYARKMTQQLLHSSADVVVSYPQNEGERSLQPSPLLKEYIKPADTLRITPESGYARLILHSRQIESLADAYAPKIEQGKTVSGGSGLFKDQSLCAFRACARHRLHARTLSDVDIGLDAMDRGTLIHTLMQLFWSRVKSQQSLLGMSQQDLDVVINDCVSKTIDNKSVNRPQTFSERFSALERIRLKQLLLEWLELEKLRSDFVVKACEQALSFELEEIKLQTRIDRLDQLADGRQLIIDYKTGKASVNDWFGERPDDPQLPLYAISNPTDMAGLAFARIRRGEMSYVGLADENETLPNIRGYQDSRYAKEGETWELLFCNWRQVLSDLAIAFREGDARVNPKDENACRYCDLHSLCRIYEKQTLAVGHSE